MIYVHIHIHNYYYNQGGGTWMPNQGGQAAGLKKMDAIPDFRVETRSAVFYHVS